MSAYTVISFSLYISFCLSFVFWVVIYVFCSNTLLLVFLAGLTSRWWLGWGGEGVFSLIWGEREVGCGSASLFLGGRGLRVLSCLKDKLTPSCTSGVGEDRQEIPPKACLSWLDVLQQKPVGWKQASGLIISRPCQKTTQLGSTSIRISKAMFKTWGWFITALVPCSFDVFIDNALWCELPQGLCMLNSLTNQSLLLFWQSCSHNLVLFWMKLYKSGLWLSVMNLILSPCLSPNALKDNRESQ